MPKLSEIRAQFPMYTDVSDEQLLAGLHKTYYADLPFADFSKTIENDSKPKRPDSVLDAPNALASGFNRGLVRLAGSPVDAVANAVDLAKAVVGTPYTAITGKSAPDALMPMDRASVPGSSDWLLKQAGKNKITSAVVNPQNPEYEGGYAQAIGGGLAGATNPAQAVLGATGAVAGKAAGDMTGDTASAITASMLPTLLSGGRRAPPPDRTKARTLAAGRAEGYVVPPSHAGAGWVNNRMESIAGKASLNQDATRRNQGITDRVAARGMGLDPNQEITVRALENLRADAGRLGYAPIDQLGDIPITPSYANRIVDLENRYGKPGSGITALRNPEVSQLVGELLPASFTGPELNAYIRDLRESGNTRSGITYGGNHEERTLGKAQIAGSKAMEGLLDEHLQQFGPSNILPNLLAARKQIAESHTLQKALNPATSEVDAHVFGARVLDNKPVSGDFKTIGDFAAAFPQVTRPAAGSPTPGVSALEAMGVPAAALAGHVATGNVHGMLAGGIPLLRAPVRNMLLSKWYQKQFAKGQGPKQPLSQEEQGALSRFLLTSGVLNEPQNGPSQ